MISVRQNKSKAFLGLAIIACAIILAFQNCSPMSEKAAFPSEEDLSANAPFAYDVDLDTYAYMSCSSRPELDKSTYFTVKMGALRSGAGVFLSQPFRDFAQSYNLNSDKIEEILDANKFSRDAKLQISLRAVASLRGNPVGTGPYAGRVSTIWSSLSLPPLSTNIADTNESVKLNMSTDGLLVGSFLISDNSENDIRELVSNSGIAVVGFQGAYYSSVSERDYRLLAPYDVYGVNINGVFGKGYDPAFKAPVINGNNMTAHGLRALGSLTERTVLDGTLTATASWNCKSQAQYRIVPFAEVAAAGCDPNATNLNLSGDEAKAYQAAQALLISSVSNGSSKWKIDQAHRCIIDLQSSTAVSQCYDMTLPIQWGTNAATDFCGGSNPKQCPQYMSICWK